MTTLQVGVLDGPHGKGKYATTVGELAEILEAKYALFSQFVDLEFDAIDAALAESLDKQIHAMMVGQPVPANPFHDVEAKLTAAFVRYIETEEIVKSGVPGIPTKAALEGRNSRLKGRKGPRRTSFIDTSVLVKSLRVWVEADQ